MTTTSASTPTLTVEYGFAAKNRNDPAASPLPRTDALTGKKWHPTVREATAAARRSTTVYSAGAVIIQRWVSAAQEVPVE